MQKKRGIITSTVIIPETNETGDELNQRAFNGLLKEWKGRDQSKTLRYWPVGMSAKPLEEERGECLREEKREEGELGLLTLKLEYK